jgi:hypothetical protein
VVVGSVSLVGMARLLDGELPQSIPLSGMEGRWQDRWDVARSATR